MCCDHRLNPPSKADVVIQMLLEHLLSRMFKALVLAVSFLMLVWPQLFAGRAQRRHERRLREIEAGEHEQYFEEKRSLASYPPMVRLPWWRFVGGLGVLVTLGAILVHR